MNYWAWGGKYAGHRSGEYLYSPSGKPVGWFDGEELFDFNGNYIGEVKNKDRIIANKSSGHARRGVKAIPCNVCGTSYCDYVGYAMYAGYEDFKVIL